VTRTEIQTSKIGNNNENSDHWHWGRRRVLRRET
jgi:hypothetical protein